MKTTPTTTNEALVTQFVHCHTQGSHLMRRGLAMSAMCGKIATELRRRVTHGNWLPFIEEHFVPAGIAERTVRLHIQTWERCTNKALKSANFADFVPLLDKPLDQLKPKEQEQLELFTNKVTDGETIASLAREYGAAKDLPKSKGGARISTKTPPTVEELEAMKNKMASEDVEAIIRKLHDFFTTNKDLPYTRINKEQRVELEIQLDLALEKIRGVK